MNGGTGDDGDTDVTVDAGDDDDLTAKKMEEGMA